MIEEITEWQVTVNKCLLSNKICNKIYSTIMCNSEGCSDKRAIFKRWTTHTLMVLGRSLAAYLWPFERVSGWPPMLVLPTIIFHSEYLWKQPASMMVWSLNSDWFKFNYRQNWNWCIPSSVFRPISRRNLSHGDSSHGSTHAAPAACVECNQGSESVGNQKTRKRAAGWL